MKSKAVAAILFAVSMVLFAPRPAAATWSVSISYFQRELSPYGRWEYSAAYGEVWRPTVVAATWEPYLDGEWVYTDCGWTWVSHDPFGQDPFHYGTWVWIDPWGWCWEPGYVWGPAWVTWAYTDSYIGWAPLPPTFALTASGYSGAPLTLASSRYVFVPVNSFVGTNVATARVAPAQNATILAGARRVTRFSVSGGLVRATDPPTSFIERASGKPVHRTSLAAHKLSPVSVRAAGLVSGKRVSIAASRHERAAASRQMASSSPKVARRGGTSARRVAAAPDTSRHAATRRNSQAHAGPARIHSAGEHAPRYTSPAREPRGGGREVRPTARQERRSVAAAPVSKPIHRQAPRAPAPGFAESKRGNPPPPAVRHEERRVAMNPAPPEHPRQTRQPASEPQASQSRPAPPAAAAQAPGAPHPAPGQGRGEKKEKQK
ncbi:MAG TPA: DUF6600 domain-containing protein [Thermoanaerobaculia bacterium]|nr:DUF6600 domain-containing protein [Thermoanaerobaculia bacterium]